MTATPQELLDTSIAQLQTLTAFLDNQLAASTHRASATTEIRACEEIFVSLRALIAKVQTARRIRPQSPGSEHS